MSKFAPKCMSAQADKDDPAPLMDLMKQDFRDLARVLNASSPLYLTGPARLVVPVAGSLNAYLVSDTATASSTGVNYHTVVVTRSGRSEGQVSLNSSKREIAAYKALYCGTFQVGAGDIMSFTLTVNGAPVPTLTASNISMLCVLTPTETTT